MTSTRRVHISAATTSMLKGFATRITHPSVVVKHLLAKPELTMQDRKSLITALSNVGFTHYTQ